MNALIKLRIIDILQVLREHSGHPFICFRNVLNVKIRLSKKSDEPRTAEDAIS